MLEMYKLHHFGKVFLKNFYENLFDMGFKEDYFHVQRKAKAIKFNIEKPKKMYFNAKSFHPKVLNKLE